MSLSLIIPVYNEVNQIEFSLKNSLNSKKIFKKIEIIFINDFCTDGTEKVIKNFKKNKNFIKLFNKKKRD